MRLTRWFWQWLSDIAASASARCLEDAVRSAEAGDDSVTDRHVTSMGRFLKLAKWLCPAGGCVHFTAYFEDGPVVRKLVDRLEQAGFERSPDTEVPNDQA